MASLHRLEPTVETVAHGSFQQLLVRAKVNRHEPDIVLYLIDAGMKFFISETRTGIGGALISGHRRRADAEKKALRIVGKRFRDAEKAAQKRTTLYG
ncbi:hypothetical protein [Glutamicibacter creatinolyticus]|uniref:hypothetical protein n=1 Tax=Glutamicibacter creatinolyticus TaxID=162496 RepID=UPI0032165FE8